MELTDQSPQRFTSLLGFLSHIRFAFASARFLSSALIFSIRVTASGVRILRVEFTCAPSQKLLFSRLVPFRKRAIKKALLGQHNASSGHRLLLHRKLGP